MGSSRRRRKKIIKKHKQSGRIRAQRDRFWMRKAVRMIHREKLSGYSKFLLIIFIGTAKRLRFARDLRGGGWLRSQKTGSFWDQ